MVFDILIILAKYNNTALTKYINNVIFCGRADFPGTGITCLKVTKIFLFERIKYYYYYKHK